MRLETYGKAVVVRSDILSDGSPDTKLFAKQLREAGGSWNSRLKTTDPNGWVFAGSKAPQILALINSFNAQTGAPQQVDFVLGGDVAASSSEPDYPSDFRPGSPGLSSWAATSSSSVPAPTFTFPSGQPIFSAPAANHIYPKVSESMKEILSAFPDSEAFENEVEKHLDAFKPARLIFHEGLYAVRAHPPGKEDLLHYGSVAIGNWVFLNFLFLSEYMFLEHSGDHSLYILVDENNYFLNHTDNVPSTDGLAKAYSFSSRNLVDLEFHTLGQYFTYNGAMLTKSSYKLSKYTSVPQGLNLMEENLIPLVSKLIRVSDVRGILLQKISALGQYLLFAEVGNAGAHKAYRIIYIDIEDGQFDTLIEQCFQQQLPGNFPYLLSLPADIVSKFGARSKEFIIIVDSLGPKFYYSDGRPVQNMVLVDDTGYLFNLSGHWRHCTNIYE